jgi:succinoglycan biosynthesis protein ExoM
LFGFFDLYEAQVFCAVMDMNKPVITICICTYKRPESLRFLLECIADQETGELFDLRVVVVDNDVDRSAQCVAEMASTILNIPFEYYNEPVPNIALARNKSIEVASGDYCAFIDDDEYPGKRWLANLFNCIHDNDAQAVLGPVETVFDSTAPLWIRKSGLMKRPRHKTGTKLSWQETRMGNAIVDRAIIMQNQITFDSRFGILGGEDIMFFRRLFESGFTNIIWCDEAVVYEPANASRLTFRWQLRRAIVQGNVSYGYYISDMTIARRAAIISKALSAMFIYTAIMPALLVVGYHHAMRYIIKCFHHGSRLWSAMGMRALKTRGL